MSSTTYIHDRALSAREAGERIGVGSHTMRRYVREGRLPGFVIPGRAGMRILESDLAVFLAELRDKGKV